MVRYFFKICYIGTKYRGSQKFVDFANETVQGAIEAALETLKPRNTPLTSFASRTDKGVHALMNTFHVDLEHKRTGEVYQPYFLKKQLNSYLSGNNHEIIVTNASVVPDSFHARYHVKSRTYLYRLAILRPELRIEFPETRKCVEYLPISLLNRCHVVPSNLNLDVVKDVVNMYCGFHDFTAFTKFAVRDSWRKFKRVVEIQFYELPTISAMNDPQYSNINLWEFHVKSPSFLYHQVRKLVGTAISAGFGMMKLSDVKDLLDNPSPEKFCKIAIAPPCGLYLGNLHYDKEGFIAKELSNDHKKEPPATT